MTNFDAYERVETSSQSDEEKVLLGRPYVINLINDRLVISDTYDDGTLTWVPLNLRSSTHNFTRGSGPGEITTSAVPFAHSDKEKIIIKDAGTNKFYTYEWKDAFKGKSGKPLQTVDLSGQTSLSKIVPFGENYFCYRYLNDQQMFSLLNAGGDVLLRFGHLPKNFNMKYADDETAMHFMANCTIAANPDESIVVAAGLLYDLFAFYKVENGEATLLKEYNTYAPDQDIDISAAMTSAHDNERTMRAYNCLVPTDKYLFALYYGVKAKQERTNDECFIQVFDWDGNFVKGFRLNEHLSSFAVDEATMTLYGIVRKGDYHISTFKLTGL